MRSDRSPACVLDNGTVRAMIAGTSQRLQRNTVTRCLLAAAALLSLVHSAAFAQAQDDCGLNAPARALATLVIQDPEQQRKRLVCNRLLSEIADAKAREMAALQRVAHLGWNSANRRLIDAGYPLSSIYPRLLENNVEAIAGGLSDPEAVWREFKASDTHRMHLLGEHEFYRLQDEIGAGFYEDPSSPHVEYWVVYIAHRGGDERYRGEIAESKE